jgi:predicted RNA-binding Zn-ribbon protein involved in translation (DUF1610 family)
MSDEARATPFYCPYCGETGIRPAEAARTYHCPTCDRRFSLAYLGAGSGVAS